MATAALALTPLIPGLAFRLARLRLPPVPATADDLRDDALLAPAADVRPRARRRTGSSAAPSPPWA